jgi:hypothetical protein
MVTLLWPVLGRVPPSRVESKKHDQVYLRFYRIDCRDPPEAIEDLQDSNLRASRKVSHVERT